MLQKQNWEMLKIFKGTGKWQCNAWNWKEMVKKMPQDGYEMVRNGRKMVQSAIKMDGK